MGADGCAGGCDNRKGSDAARAAAAGVVSSQNSSEATNVSAISADHAKATGDAAEAIN